VFRTKLYLAFFAMAFITLLQASMAIWAGQVASNEVNRGRIANQMLTELIALSADKQRLKVWLAQDLLVKDAAIAARDQYLLRMHQSLQTIDKLLLQDQALATEAADFMLISKQMKNLSILETNVASLQSDLAGQSSQPKLLHEPAETWRVLIQTFDNLQGLDLKKIIAESIDIQKQRSATAEQAAAAALEQAKLLLMITGLFGSISALLFAFLLAKSSYRPLQSLLEGTAAISRGLLSYRLSEQGNAEFALLSRSFNQMAVALERAHVAEQAHAQQIELIVQERTAQLQQALADLQQAESVQKRFLADVSHELRTPATAIRGEAEVMLRGKDKTGADYKDSLLRIVETSTQLASRIDELLMLVRGDSELHLRFKHVHLSQVWSGWVSLFQRLNNSSAADIRWAMLTDEQAQLQLYLDPERTLQAIQIVLDNAMKYGVNQPIELQLSHDATQLQLVVVDHGIGVPAAELDQLFQRFYRASNARLQRPDGLGIGLSLCQSIMQAQHGSIRLQSPLDPLQQTGTMVVLKWPLASDEDDVDGV
jgi:signal transduction histidine kinase